MIKKSHPPDNFSTSDIFVASYLRLTGCKLRAIDRTDPKRVRFVFKSPAKEHALDYFNGAEISACRFASAVAESRNLIFDTG